MKLLIVGLAGASLLLARVSQIHAGLLFDNGSASGPNVGRQNSNQYTIYEDFTLSAAAVVEGVEWAEHDGTQRIDVYTSTDIAFFNGIPSVATQIFSVSIVASRTPNGSALLFDVLSGFDYSVSGLALNLAAGTYFIGIHNNFDNNGISTWDQTEGTGSTIAGRYQSSTPPDAGSFYNEDSAFRVLGTIPSTQSPGADPDAVALPEPASLSVFSILLGAFVAGRVGRRPGSNSDEVSDIDEFAAIAGN